jgi:predicted membrane-bound spermidine synthase
MFGEQKRYADKIILPQQTPYQKITLTKSKGDCGLYILKKIK